MELSQNRRILLNILVSGAVGLLFLTIASYFVHVCHVGDDGYSLFIGNGRIEYGYEWDWIRARVFHHSRVPPLGWTIQRALPPITGYRSGSFAIQIPGWCLIVFVTALAFETKFGRIKIATPSNRLFIIFLFWGFIEIQGLFVLVAAKGNYPWDHDEIVDASILLATIAVVVPIIFDRLLGPSKSPNPSRSSDPPMCKRCKYNLTGNVSGICPECGTPIAGAVSSCLEFGAARSS